MPKFTPGPWEAIAMTIFDAAGRTIGNAHPNGPESEMYREHALRGEANARLIAAAPQMFDLLMELQAVATDLGHEDDSDLSGRDADEMRDIGWRAYTLLQGRQLLPEGEY